jgi:cytochrome c oxidase subunit 2
MKVEKYEKAFLWLGGLMLIVFMIALTISSVAMGIHLPGRGGEIDPATAATTPPFDEPGVREIGPGQYEVVLIGQAWFFNPAEIRVPVGSEVTFVATTVDVIHGIAVEGTRVNMMLIPGQVARNTYRFNRRGEFNLVCHEYCGAGHHLMSGKVIVE